MFNEIEFDENSIFILSQNLIEHGKGILKYKTRAKDTIHYYQ